MVRLAFYIRGSQEMERLVPPISEAIRGSGGIDRIKLRLYEGKESEYSPRTCSIGRPAGGTLCPHPITL